MKTALLLTNSTESQQLFTRLLGDQTNLILLAPPDEPSREKFDALFTTWLRLVDGVVLDAVALGELTRLAVESLRAARLLEHQSVVVHATESQTRLHPVNGDWLVVRDTDPQDQMERSLRTFLDLRAAQAQLKRADALLERQRLANATPVGTLASTTPNAESMRYRDALKNFAHVLGQHPDENALLIEFLRVVRELLGVGKLAIFTRCFQNDLFTEQLTLHGNQLAIVGSSGIAPNVVEHFRLNVDFGLAGQLARTSQILRRAQVLDPLALDHDPQVAREFEALGTEFAVPMFDNDQLLGVLTFSGKITGETLANEELELVYHLLNQLAQVIRNLHLQAKVVGQQLFTGEVLANIQTGVLVIGQNNRVLCANPQTRAILDLGDADFVGQDLNRLPPCVGDTLYSVLQTGQPAHAVELALPGTRRPLRLHAARFTTSLAGGDQMVVALVEDLTQTKIQEAQARELADREFFTRLAARLSHELKNALVSVKIYAQLIPERHDDPEFREEFSRTVVNEVNRVDALINNLTFFSHPLGLVPENLDLAAVLDTTLKTITEECRRQQKLQIALFGEKVTEVAGLPMVSVKRTYQHRAVRVAGDRIRLIQAFEHVLRNAFQALDQGGRLGISTADAVPADFSDGQLPPGGAVKIEFQDTGEGIALEQVPHVTEPFMTTRNVGVGLGLTIVKKIIERHSGRLLIDSLLGKGTTVTVLLPVKAQPHPEDHLSEDHRDGAAVAATPARNHAETPHPVH